MTFDEPFPEPLPVAGASAILGGVASIWEPFFLGLCVAASALAAVAWLLRAGGPRGDPRAFHALGHPAFGLGLVAAGWTVYLAGGAYLGRFVALPLAATAGLLWIWGTRPAGPRGAGR